MKKVLAVLLAVMMVFAIAACTKKDTVTDDKTPENDVQTPVGETGGENTDDEQTSADKTTDNDTLVMATNAYFQPYEYYEGDKIVGIDAEIAEAIAAKLGKTLKIEDMQFDSILTAVQEGSVDFGMAGMTVTEERLESVNFTSSYATGIQSVIVKEDSPITSVDDLFADDAAYKAGVQLGTTGQYYTEGDEDWGFVGFPVTCTGYKSGSLAVQDMLNGNISYVIIDQDPANYIAKAINGGK